MARRKRQQNEVNKKKPTTHFICNSKFEQNYDTIEKKKQTKTIKIKKNKNIKICSAAVLCRQSKGL